MKTANLQHTHATDITRGRANPHRATARGITVRDDNTDVEPVTDVLFAGATVTDTGDGTATVTFGGGGGGDSGGAASVPVQMLNNSGQDLLPGDVVVTDDTADTAVTVTTSAGSVLIAGIVQEPIPDGSVGPVLFNGYAPVVNAAGSRGDYLQTSTTAALADTTATREAGSFGVLLTGNDLSDFVAGSATTSAATLGEALSIDLPAIVPLNRVLFLALWLDSSTSSIDIPGWTRIGAEAGYYYFTRISTGSDDAEATWTGLSTSLAVVLLLHNTVSLGVPLEDHDYDSTTSAAAVSSLSDVARYAIAGVDADVPSPGSGFTWLAGGTAELEVGTTPSIVQSKQVSSVGNVNITFDSPVTAGNVIVAAGVKVGASAPTLSAWTIVDAVKADDCCGNGGAEGFAFIAYLIADGSTSTFGRDSDATHWQWRIYELANADPDSMQSLSLDHQNPSGTTGTFDLGDFTSASGVAIQTIVETRGSDQANQSGNFTMTGWTERFDNRVDPTDGSSHPWVGIGDKAITSEALDAAWDFTESGGGSQSIGEWAGVSVVFGIPTSSVSGTLAGKYIAHASSATSPFTGGSEQNDAIFAINLLADAKPAALLYGPDLAGEGGSEPTADAHIADTTDAHDASAISVADAGGYFTGTDVEAVLQELGAASGGTLQWFIVTDPTYGAANDATTDDTSAINAAIAALNAAGTGVLYFPAGTGYKVTGALTSLTVPCLVLGDGGSYSTPATKIIQTSTTAHTFTQAAHGVVFQGLAGVRSGAASSNGSFIRVTVGNRGAYRNLSAEGFWINIDFDDGAEWWMGDCFWVNGVKYNARIRHIDLPDGGDWSIEGCRFGSIVGSDAHIRYESGGGGKILGCKFNGATTQPVLGIDLSLATGIQTSVLVIAGNSFENMSSHAIKIATAGTGRFGHITITGNQFGLYGNNSGRIVYVNAASTGGWAGNGTISNIVIDAAIAHTDGTARAAIELVNCDNVVLGDIALSGFNARYTSSGATNISDGASPSGAAGGDLSGTYPNPSVVDDSHNHTTATLPVGAGSYDTDGLISVEPYDTYSVTGSPPDVTITTKWGISAGVPYYDSAGAAAGEEAALYYNPANDEFVLVAYGF